MTLRWPSTRFGGVAINMGLVLNRASLSTFVANSGLSQEFASHETVAVNTAKTWDSPRAGTVSVLLPATLKLALFDLVR